ncbi:hypothetical protein H257_18708 [Aphanomyces astaci]|uniref:Uncharacterized protein n=1 Tax=Aphanomyces astaci TaxID=112090 RepID=W4FBT9_APHAT|nr:hypothetical protein H257_18708 [Aphanomyces astaci]ETV64384.1 hypothetical protein H257_18708 [Aphanomyces astaci]|eukprot:XP_009846127.1 hypothetical protein H257_18708 [Aphanomyces astaci]
MPSELRRRAVSVQRDGVRRTKAWAINRLPNALLLTTIVYRYLRMKTSTRLIPLSKAPSASAPGSVRLATVAQDQEAPTTIVCGMTATHTSKNDRFDDAA